MFFSLIICTYKRALPLQKLLISVQKQEVYPNEILIIDGSPDNETESLLTKVAFDNLKYYKVSPEHRGLTKQRNFGISKLSNQTAIVCFLDDDTVLEPTYFTELLSVYSIYPNALGVGGYINNEVMWERVSTDYNPAINEFVFDSFKRKDGSRFILRKKLGLDSDKQPGFLPEFSNGRSIGFLPPSGKIYQVEQLMGGVSSFRKSVFDTFSFSTYFEGYGLYEDADFTLRLSKVGDLYVNTKAQLAHYHDASGRPNQYAYGKMVVRNGWYVWRVKYPQPSLKAKLKWHAIVWLLTIVRLSNTFNTSNKKEAFTESCGRIIAWFFLFFIKPLKKPAE